VKPQYGLTDAEMEQMLLAGFTHAKQDVETRLQIEAREEARQLVYQAQRFLDKHAAALTAAERSQMADAVAQLQQQVDAGADKQALHAAMDALDTLSRPFAQRVMEDALRTAMVGKGVGEVE
jgi:molecular chaperone HscA